MTGIPAIDAFIGVLGAIATAFSMFWGGRKLMAESKALKSPPPTPYEALAARVTDLEASDQVKGKELTRLRGQVRRLAGVMSREVVIILDWIDGGAMPPPPARESRVVRELIRDIDSDMTD